jgi:hypothetical protein
LLREPIILNVSELAQQLVKCQILLFVLFIVSCCHSLLNFLLLHFLRVHPEFLPSVQSWDWINKFLFSIAVHFERVKSFHILRHFTTMMLHVKWQIATFISVPWELLVPIDTLIIMKGSLPIIYTSHDRIALKIKSSLWSLWFWLFDSLCFRIIISLLVLSLILSLLSTHILSVCK